MAEQALFTSAPGKEEELERVLTTLIEPTRREARLHSTTT